MKRPLGRNVVALGLAALSSGCTYAKYTYDSAIADLAVKGLAGVAVATHDQREYVLSGGKGAQFVGLERSPVGIPRSVQTASGRPLSDDMTTSIAVSLEKNGFKALQVFVLPGDSSASVQEALKATRAQRLVLLTVNEWKTDIFTGFSTSSIKLVYKANLVVSDGSGKTLGRASIEGQDAMQAKPADAGPIIDAFRGKLEVLFSDPSVVKALQ